MNKQVNSPLGTAPIGKLMLKMALPNLPCVSIKFSKNGPARIGQERE